MTAILSSGNVDEVNATTETPQQPQSTVIPGADSLIGDLLDMDLGGPTMQQMYPPAGPTSQTPIQSSVAMDLLGEGLDSLLGSSSLGGDMLGGLGDIFGMPQSQSYVPPQEVF